MRQSDQLALRGQSERKLRGRGNKTKEKRKPGS